MSETEEKEEPVNGIEVKKVIGSPGSGKTTRVVGNPELELDGLFIENEENHPLDDQMLVTYTNAAVDEATDRLYKMTDYPKYKIEERVTTIHSRSFQVLNLEYTNTVQHYNKDNFCSKFGLEFGYDDDEDDIMGGDLDEGNALFRIYDWLKSNRKDIDEWRDCPIEWEWDNDPLYLMQEWDNYKEHHGLQGFGDMIEDVVEWGREYLLEKGYGPLFPDDDITAMEVFRSAREDPMLDKEELRGSGPFIDTKVLYVDEVQDLTPLQWCWYLLQKLVCKEVYIGGDDDQTIYGWAGADPEFMLNEEGEFEVLETTYRIPAQIWEVCDSVIQQVDERQSKEVTPDGPGGEFITYFNPSKRQLIEHLKEGEWLILFRARYQIDQFTDDLHEYGIPYRNMSTFDIWEDDLCNLRDALAKLENGCEKMKGYELDAMMEYADDGIITNNNGMDSTEKAMGQFGGISMERVNDVFDLTSDYRKIDLTARNFLNRLHDDDEINYYEKQAILGNVKAGNSELDPDRIRIGTIHSAKGKEADNVLVATDSTQTIIDSMDDQLDIVGSGQHGAPITDAERRVYYVGMTRAAEKLILAESVTDCDYAISIQSIVGDDIKVERETPKPW